ncbi:MAG: class I SAM-dependent methyltransferase [Candidatus Saccharimonadales bacterium]
MIWIFWVIAIPVLLFGFVVFRGAPYVPSKKRDVILAFTQLYPLSKKDLVVDIGSGDGIVLRAAAMLGARAVGYELNPLLVMIARFLSRNQPDVQTILADFWRIKLPRETTVIYTFGESRDIKKMAAKIQNEATRLQKTLAFISYGFEVPGLTLSNKTNAHFLYHITPLQRHEP